MSPRSKVFVVGGKRPRNPNFVGHDENCNLERVLIISKYVGPLRAKAT
jgi:hypothetical protein